MVDQPILRLRQRICESRNLGDILLERLTSISIDVFTSWVTWPYLLVCLSGLQSINGLGTWGATIIKSLGFSSIRANLLSAPAPILASLFGFILASFVDRYKRFGYAIMVAAIWTLAGLIALYVWHQCAMEMYVC